MTKIFITGATSSIGAHLVKFLLQEDTKLHLLVRKNPGFELFNDPRILLFEGDLSSEETILNAMEGCSQVYHLAANASVWQKDPKVYFETNVRGTQTILEAALKSNIDRVVVTSSAGVLGPSITNIVSETKAREMDFFNEYESSKAISELLIHNYVCEKRLDVVIVSPTRVYGPILFGPISSTTLLIDKFINGKWRIYPGTSKEIGNYAYIEDVATGHILAMKNGIKGDTYILGGTNCTYIEFYGLLITLSGVKRRMFVVPRFIQKLFATIQLMNAQLFGIKPAITPKWLAKGYYNWEVSSDKAISTIGYSITPMKKGLEKTIQSISKNKF
ncbi:MAG: hypothetical protein RI922_1216 [Bacteroidota bacterium]|jgi:nucleoside-diphosphate-sugar epimerase